MPPGFGLRTTASTLFLYASALTAQNLLYSGTQPFIAVEAPVIAHFAQKLPRHVSIQKPVSVLGKHRNVPYRLVQIRATNQRYKTL
jgi:hypothetical protein